MSHNFVKAANIPIKTREDIPQIRIIEKDETITNKSIQEILEDPYAAVAVHLLYLDAQRQVSEGQYTEGSWDEF